MGLCPAARAGHPRGCGEQRMTNLSSASATGSSPRVRGTERYEKRFTGKDRVIPAGAGNRRKEPRKGTEPAGHPRGCGEQRRGTITAKTLVGSSPRVRGTGLRRADARDDGRVIPAGAGNRTGASCFPITRSGHPRGCGEQSFGMTRHNARHGSSPRVRGTDRAPMLALALFRVIPAGAGNSLLHGRHEDEQTGHPRGCGEQSRMAASSVLSAGSSPRVRGTEILVGLRTPERRVIPAGAGNRRPAWFLTIRVAGHPRGCGEQAVLPPPMAQRTGSSPRVRGTGPGLRWAAGHDRVIPAGAGNSVTAGDMWTGSAGHPRGCGEQATTRAGSCQRSGSSPRVRGTDGPEREQRPDRRVIPAGAGNSGGRCFRRSASSGHPRGCGEQLAFSRTQSAGFGSSPRVRGTVAGSGVVEFDLRVIPAGAGNRTS